MRNSGSSGLWPFLALVAVGSTVLSMMGSSDVQGVQRACCFDNADCEVLTRSQCEGVFNATSQAIGTNCSTVTCPLLCNGSDAPACNGDCPPSFSCSETPTWAGPEAQGGTAAAGGGAEVAPCQCLAGACCFASPPAGANPPGPQCSQQLNESACEGAGGMYQGDGTNCSACDSLCGFMEAPACGDGECPPGEACTFHEANGVPERCECEPAIGACCQPGRGGCFETAQLKCEGQGNTYQGDNTNCSTVECPRTCGFSYAPECGGDCPEGQQCLQNDPFNVSIAGGGAGITENEQCQCFTPPGGECDPAQDTCQPDFVCDPSSEVCCNRICDGPGETCDNTGICHVQAPAPAVSDTGLLIIIALLLATGGIGLLRRRVHGQ